MSTPDFRTRVAAEKRERMRTRLIEAALEVFSTKGVEATVIEDLIEQAQVSRGTFYNYFRTTEEAMAAVLQAVVNELLSLVDMVIANRPDPAERLACGVRMVLHTARQFPHAGRFIARLGVTRSLDLLPALDNPLRDLVEGIETGRFNVADPMLGLDLVAGTTSAALLSLSLRTDLTEAYPQEITFHILLGLGMTRAAARKLVDKPIDAVQLPPESLLVRTLHKHLQPT
ncbi:TetR/AcrR family transcriptional regulator [Aquabacterium soli]|uniref:TetR/AcrR family transcriptional regulator n=1 Tax=Aquabacterium soli TaxID=2493092 RepID=A0A426V636_9BURK|nr:TetR/AcrR family transcriptional regulator [Aquabacterium soli]RRS02352.1 TetR/AcrR family transcriptional regulator [Aquabacterium soli]